MLPTAAGLLAAASILMAAPVHACGEALPPPKATAESARYAIAWQTRPAPVPVAEHFVIDLVVCPKAGAPAPDRIRVDARMPAHRHGMNYRPTVTRLGDARYRVEGMMFHMPGHWVLEFELGEGATVDRIQADVRL